MKRGDDGEGSSFCRREATCTSTVRVDGVAQSDLQRDDGGAVRLDLPVGTHRVEVAYDKEFGFPVSVLVHPVPRPPDSVYRVEVRDFETLEYR